jgi:hypothetical protein
LFELETDRIIAAMSERLLPGEQARIPVRDILAATIPHPLKVFFWADAHALLRREIESGRRGSRFPYDHPDAQALDRQMSTVLVLNFAYSRSEFTERLSDAVHMMTNYLVRPQWTLANVFFEKQPGALASRELENLFRYFSPYSYLKAIILRYTREKNISSYTQRDFAALVRRADGEFIRRKSGAELSALLVPMYDFFSYGVPHETPRTIPVKGLVKFFEDKGMAAVATQLEGELLQGKSELTRAELADSLDAVKRTFGAFDVEAARPEAEDPSYATIEALKAAFSVSERLRITRKIFREEEAAFTSALAAIAGYSSWKQTSKFIDEIFIRNDVNPYSSEAKHFLDVMFQHYHPRH